MRITFLLLILGTNLGIANSDLSRVEHKFVEGVSLYNNLSLEDKERILSNLATREDFDYRILSSRAFVDVVINVQNVVGNVGLLPEELSNLETGFDAN